MGSDKHDEYLVVFWGETSKNLNANRGVSQPMNSSNKKKRGSYPGKRDAISGIRTQ